jgi:hypothetical protein
VSPASRAATPNKPLRVVAVAITAVSVAFAVGLSVFIYYMVRPRGDRVGDINLADPLASLLVDGRRGDSLVFRVDAGLRVPRLSLMSDDALEQRASTQLTRSMLTVRAFGPNGSEGAATCAVYRGRATSTTSTPGTFARSGMLNDCVIPIQQSGQWSVRGSVAWHPELTIDRAALEVRIERAR